MKLVENAVMALKIRALRKERGWSQAHLADLANLSRSQLSEIENEKKPANTRRLVSIAQALGVSVDDLFQDDGKIPYKSAILNLMTQLSEADRDIVLAMARSLAEKNPRGEE